MNYQLACQLAESFFANCTITEYEYLGSSQIVIQRYVEPGTDVVYTLATGADENPYAGLDLFGRIIDLKSEQCPMPTTLVKLKHGYDLASNRLYRRDEVSRVQTTPRYFDELYGYDGLDRLTSFARCQLNGGNTSISGPTLTQNWPDLDPVGIGTSFSKEWSARSTRPAPTPRPTKSMRSTSRSGTSGYDGSGNTVTFPDPCDLTAELAATYDAWNRLVKVENGGTVGEYQYDGLGRQIVKTANSVTRHYYHSDQWQVLEERMSIGASKPASDRRFKTGQR